MMQICGISIILVWPSQLMTARNVTRELRCSYSEFKSVLSSCMLTVSIQALYSALLWELHIYGIHAYCFEICLTRPTHYCYKSSCYGPYIGKTKIFCTAFHGLANPRLIDSLDFCALGVGDCMADGPNDEVEHCAIDYGEPSSPQIDDNNSKVCSHSTWRNSMTTLFIASQIIRHFCLINTMWILTTYNYGPIII